MRNWSIPAGRIFGVEIRIHLTFLFLLVFVRLTDSASHRTVNPGRGLALVGIIFVSVLLHELGHALASMHGGVAAQSLILLSNGRRFRLDGTKCAPAPRVR